MDTTIAIINITSKELELSSFTIDIFSTLVSNFTVSLRRWRVVSGEIKARFGWRESPVIKEGDEKMGDQYIASNSAKRE